MTYTVAIMEVSSETYIEVRAKLDAAGYDHAIMEDGSLNMTHIALQPEVLKDHETIEHGFHWFHSERSSFPAMAQLTSNGWFCINETGPVTMAELNRRGWEYLGPARRPYSEYLDT